MFAFVVNAGHVDPKVVPLEQLLEKLGHVILRKETIRAVVDDPALKASADSLILIPTTESSHVSVEEVIGLASQFKGQAFAIYVTDEISQADYKALVRTGGADCVGWDSAKGEIFEICRRRHAGGAKARAPSGFGGAPPVVVSFLGTGGGAGNTTLALETGVYLASLKGADVRRVAVVDLDFKHSVMCDYVNLSPRLDMADFVRNPERLDEYMLDIFTSKHPSGLHLFACDNNDIDYSAMDGKAVFALLDHLTNRFDTVLLDVPRCGTAWLDNVLKNSDFVFVTGRHSVPSVKQIAYELRRLRTLDLKPENMGIIINWCQKGLLGGIARKSDIVAVLGGQQIFYVQQDPSFALDCVNIGASMAESGPRHGICRDIKKISEVVQAVTPRVAPG
jgi:pilus assembly protein CpaE